MSKHGNRFTPEDKSRINRAETLKYGHTPKDGLGSKVQSQVDSAIRAPRPVPSAPKK